MNINGRRIGDRGRYEIVQLLGEGGMGAVYEATDTKMGCRVAIKLLSAHLSGNDAIRRRFHTEGTIQAKLKHPNLVPATDRFDDDGQLGIVMDFIEGETLEEHLARGPLSLAEIYEILAPVCQAIAYVHKANIIHRDLKPGNIMLDRSHGRMTPKVLDFGIAKLLTDDARSLHRTQLGFRLGTPAYMSPEQHRGENDLDARTDVYALGVIAYQMALGELPTTDPSTYVAPSLRVAGLSAGFDELVSRALEANRSRRIATVEHFASALHALVLQLGGDVSTGPHPQIRPVPRPWPVSPTPMGGSHQSTTRSPNRPQSRISSPVSDPHTLSVTVQPELAGSIPPTVAAVPGHGRRTSSWGLATTLVAAVTVLFVIFVNVSSTGSVPRRTASLPTPSSAAGCGERAPCTLNERCIDGQCRASPIDLPAGMVWVPGQQFEMGDGCMGNNPAHRVVVSGFAIDQRMPEPDARYSWHDARRACQKRGLDLPTEAQWELAAIRGLIELPTTRGDWVRDWYHSETFRRAEAVDPTGPSEKDCEVDPGSWRKSPHWSVTERCNKVIRGVQYKSCDRTRMRSHFGPSVASLNRGYRCVRQD